MAVNLRGPKMLLDLLVPVLPAGGSVTFYSSLWSSFYPHPQIPVYYLNVAESKREMERWLEIKAVEWARLRITTAILSSTWIADTRIGQVLDRFSAELLIPAERKRWRSTYVTCSEILTTTLDVLGRVHGNASGGLVRLYLLGSGQIVANMGPDDPPMPYAIALAPNAPTWSEASVTSGT
jgi:NAD(P)-dependent dehydrogenase (short-subunit alcohol dehydrogenase family)